MRFITYTVLDSFAIVEIFDIWMKTTFSQGNFHALSNKALFSRNWRAIN